MSSQYPAFRLVALIARQASAPIASRIKTYAKAHPRFSNTVCIRTAHAFQYMEYLSKCITLRAAGIPSKWMEKHPPAPLSPKEALEKGGDILGEIVIFFLGSCILIFELNRQAEKAQAKEIKEKEAWGALLLMLDETGKQLESQQKRIDALKVVLQETLEEQEAEGKAKTGEKSGEGSYEAESDDRVLILPGAGEPGGPKVTIPDMLQPRSGGSESGSSLQQDGQTGHKAPCRCCECCKEK